PGGGEAAAHESSRVEKDMLPLPGTDAPDKPDAPLHRLRFCRACLARALLTLRAYLGAAGDDGAAVLPGIAQRGKRGLGVRDDIIRQNAAEPAEETRHARGQVVLGDAGVDMPDHRRSRQACRAP